ncbi:DUF3564 family protein [Caballeronia sp. BR00000012568055]|uniref:DUF3564 family protein n=1 Tax=Caballeronia sp. BR00000012568055 TaxID=2918761 RepID=UPI0023F99284|nr:DUF3564 family protein [Caballeronia sp. BR00000012568055]
MRITLKLDAFSDAKTSDYAVIWLDQESGRWSRESHDGIELPSWGIWKPTENGTLLLPPDAGTLLFLLRGLRLGASPGFADRRDSQAEQNGRVVCLRADMRNRSRLMSMGHWHVQCVDRDSIVAEHEIFSDEPGAPQDRNGNRRHIGTSAP